MKLPIIAPVTPDAPTPVAPTPEAPTPEAPTPEAPTPEAPTPEAPTPEAPTPDGTGVASESNEPNASNDGGAPQTRRDLGVHQLHALLTDFYAVVEADTLLAPYFATTNMEAHMPRIVAFWETLVFQLGTYSGNAFRPHLDMPGLGPEHFARWVGTMEQTVDRHAAGPRAERMKDLAHRVAYSMQLRLGIAPFAEWRREA